MSLKAILGAAQHIDWGYFPQESHSYGSREIYQTLRSHWQITANNVKRNRPVLSVLADHNSNTSKRSPILSVEPDGAHIDAKMLFRQLLDRAVVDELLDDRVELRLERDIALLDADADTARAQNVAAHARAIARRRR